MSIDNNRIAKNTILLSFRTIIIMFVTLFTSRVVLQALGVEDFGVYSAVGGIVAIFSMITTSMSSAISRFLTYSLGKGDYNNLSRVYSTSINIQFCIIIIIGILTLLLGEWLLLNYMVIPSSSLVAARVVLRFSIITFVLQFITVPFRSLIIAYERMAVFAYLGIIEVILKLLVAYLLYVATSSKLVVYSVLLCGVTLIILLIHIVYCRKSFPSVKYSFNINFPVVKEMLGFSIWSLLPNTAYLLNTQGINVLMNMFFGVLANAARGIATQVESAISTFVGNFTTALNPPITKAFAAGDINGMIVLIRRGVKFSFIIILMIAVPLVVECEQILEIWLGEVPKYAVSFAQCAILSSLVLQMGNPMITGILATGNIRRYQIEVTLIGCMVFPLTWIAYKFNSSPQISYVIFILIYLFLNLVRMMALRRLIKFPMKDFLKDEMLKMGVVFIISFVLTFLISNLLSASFFRLIIIFLFSCLLTSLSSYLILLDTREREFIVSKIVFIINKLK